MTVVVAFLCTDGVVVGCDSMITPSMGNIQVGHHKGRKIYPCPNQQLFALSGDVGNANRMRYVIEQNNPALHANHPIDYPLAITNTLVQQFQQSGAVNAIGFNAILAYVSGGVPCCAQFLGNLIQPSLLDKDSFYTALGSGKMSADPFLRFVVDTFCGNGQPTVQEAIFLTTWVIQHVIETNPGGVAGPIKIGCLTEESGAWSSYELADAKIQEGLEAVDDASEALREWASKLFRSDDLEAGELPTPPEIS